MDVEHASDRRRLKQPAVPELAKQACALARKLKLNCDLEVYEAAARDWDEAILYSGSLKAPIGFFGRDPGRDEIKQAKPLVGAAGRRVREAVLEKMGEKFEIAKGRAAHDTVIEASERRVFFSNTVPYKQVGNKAWGPKITREFAPIIASVLVDQWSGHDIITLGNEAFHWFLLSEADEASAEKLESRMEFFWADERRYERSLEIDLLSPLSGRRRQIRVHPLPHPSPLNVTWYKRFPALLQKRLDEIL